MNNKDATLIGLVTELDVFSFTDQSAQLQFKIAPPNEPEQTFDMETATADSGETVNRSQIPAA